MDQQNVKVVLRSRPMSATEKARDRAAVQCMSDKNVEVTYNSMGKSSKKQFCFDGVFDEKTTQKDFYDKVVRNVVDEVLQVLELISKTFPIFNALILPLSARRDTTALYLHMGKLGQAKRLRWKASSETHLSATCTVMLVLFRVL